MLLLMLSENAITLMQFRYNGSHVITIIIVQAIYCCYN